MVLAWELERQWFLRRLGRDAGDAKADDFDAEVGFASRGQHQPPEAGVQLRGPHEAQCPCECGSHVVCGGGK